MPKDTMERAIARGAGGLDGGDLSSLTYEGYGPGGVAVLVETVTDNKNRTVAEVRHAFDRSGGNLGTTGSVSYMFEKKGQIHIAPGADEEVVMEAAIEAGAEDVETDDDGAIEVITTPEDFLAVRDSLVASGVSLENAEIAMVPQNYHSLDKTVGEKVLRLLDTLDDLDDVQNVYTNADFPEDMDH